ncbi:MAG: 50S ribosomal protein L21 [Chloroflexota bacterium]|nr:50S ribosomal protein L21 [Chloroflexota bacterium]
MYAVVRSGSRQYRVEEGALVIVPDLDAEPGTTLTMGEVLLVADGETVKAGAPLLDGATVTAEVVARGKGEKIRVFRYKNKTRSRKLTGHRSPQTTLRITKIEA